MSDYLAWYMYPQPGGTSYTEQQLAQPAIVEQIFDYCRIGHAVVSSRGWQVMVRAHGVEGLLEINRRSGWFGDGSALDGLRDRCRQDGFELDAGGLAASG